MIRVTIDVRLIALWECASWSASDFAYKVVKGIWTSSVVSSQVIQKFMLSVDINTIDSKIMTYSFVYSVDVNINHIHSIIMICRLRHLFENELN